MKNLFLTLAFFALTILSVNAQTKETYKIDPAQSSLRWEGSKLTGVHYGNIDIKSGSLFKKGSNWGGEFIIDMNSLKNADLDAENAAKLEGHLKSADFFDAAKYPTAKLKITGIKAKKKNNYTHMVSGNLTIKGKTRKVSFPALLEFNGDAMTASASFAIDRSKWDVRYGSKSFFKSIGDKAISNDIKFEVKLTAQKEKLNS